MNEIFAGRRRPLFFKHIGINGGVAIDLEKRIPIAAGLGGGSSNAAAVLVGLNKLFGSRLDLPELQRLGLTVGADVPFCLRGGTALVAGIGGEKVKPLPHFNSAVLILVKPAAHISTGGEVYGGVLIPEISEVPLRGIL